MSVAVAIIGTDGIVVGADDCITERAGHMLRHYGGARKIWPLKDRYRLLAVNTNDGFSRWIIETFTECLEDMDRSYFALRYSESHREAMRQINSYNAIRYELATLLNSLYKEFSLDSEKLKNTDMFDLSFTLAGYDLTDTDKYIPQIYLLNTTNSFVPTVQTGYSISGLPSVGNYYIQKLRRLLFENNDERTPKASAAILKRLIALIIIETAKYTENVSDEVIMEVITPEEVISVPDSEIREIKEAIDGITSETDLMKAVGIK